MATPPAGRKTRTLCVFYEKGSCKNGDACRFTHGASDKRELTPQGGKAAGRVSASAAEDAGPATALTTKNKKPCRFFVKGKCTRGKSCPFLHSVGEDPTCSTSADGNNKNKNKNIVKADDTADDKGTPDTDTDTDRCTVKSKPKATTKVKVKVKPSAAVVDGKRGDNGAPTVTTVTAAKRSAPDEAAAGAAQAADGGPPIKPRRLGSSSFLSLSSKARFVGGAVKAAASAGESAGSWAGIVKKTAAVDADRASTSTTTTSTSTTSSTSSTSTSGEDMSAAVASAAARVKALKPAHQAARKAARAAAAASAAAAAASAGSGGGGAAAAAAAAAAVADSVCITHTFSAGEPTTNTAGRRQQQQQQLAGSTSGITDKHQEEKKKQRANTKPCTFFLRGRCRYGDRCRFSHDAVRESDGEKEEEEERGEDTVATMEAALDEAERRQSRKAECGVCLEVVRKMEGVKGRTFGILMGCRHVYCLSCITEWRDKSKSHECPECRVPSPLVVPSKLLVTDPERKARLVSNFQKSLAGVG